ncbi:nucleotide exchange factor GrpE [bacterium]|nr:nucleotide exchange factor GrpE [candidate division CSSED10-310 bacterium]
MKKDELKHDPIPVDDNALKNISDSNQQTGTVPTDANSTNQVNPISDIEEPSVEETPLETATRQASEYLDALQRLKAEFDNFRKRVAKEKQRLAEFYQASVLEALLPTLDSFDAALQKSSVAADGELHKGLTMIYDALMDQLSKLDFHRLDLLNTQFDPEVAEALMIQASETIDPDTIIGEIAAGYKFKNMILRPARVVVSKSPTDASYINNLNTGNETVKEG